MYIWFVIKAMRKYLLTCGFLPVLFFLFSSCRHHVRSPYNPYLKMKEKPSKMIANERKQNDKKIIKDGRRQLRRNKKEVYSN